MTKRTAGRNLRTSLPLTFVLVLGVVLLGAAIARVSASTAVSKRAGLKAASQTSPAGQAGSIANLPNNGVVPGRFSDLWRPRYDYSPGTKQIIENLYTSVLHPVPTLTVTAPTVSSLSPNSKVVGDSDFTLTVSGADFGVDPVTINFGGTSHPANIDDPTHVSTTISASEIATAGNVQVNVTNSSSETSGNLNFTVVNPVAALSSLSPSSKTAGQGSFVLTVSGSNFIDGAQVKFNGNNRGTLFLSDTELLASITAADIATVGSYPVTVVNPGVGASNSVNLVVNPPTPSISSLNPTGKTAGQSSFTLTVTGSNFFSGAVIHFGGTDHNATFDSSTQVHATISAAEIATAGTIPVTVSNSGSGNSGSSDFTVTNPVAVLSSLSPSSKTAGQAAFDLTVSGSSFVSGAQVKFNGSNRTTIFVSDTELTAQISASDIASAGSFPITVVNPGVGASNSVNLVVNNPVPNISSLSPSSKLAGDSSFTLTVTGSSFMSGGTIHFGGTDHSANLDDATHVSCTISAAEIATAGSIPVSVSNAGTSNSGSLNFLVSNPVPSISNLSPSSKIAGNGSFTLSVTGSSFVSGAVIHFGGSNHSASLDDATHVSATISAAEIATAGTIPVTVSNPGSSNSSSLDFTVTNPVAVLSGLSPASKLAGEAAFDLTVNGSNFVNGAQIKFNGSNRTTTFGSSTQLTAAISASDIAVAGSFPITVVNPGVGTSNSVNLIVNNPVPNISALSPSSKIAGSGSFTLTVTGSSFVTGAVIHFGGTDHSANLDDATHVSATISAAEIATAASISVSVSNVGSSNSSALSFSVVNPVAVLSGLTPSSKTAGQAAFALTVDGSNFIDGAVVKINGSSRTTLFVSSTQLTAQITASDIAVAGNFPVTVVNSGVAASNSVDLVVNNPVPSISALTPSSKIAGQSSFTLTVTGSSFVSGAVIHFGGTDHPANLDDATHVSATISAAEISSPGTIPVTVSNAGSGNSGSLDFSVTNPVAVLSSLSPATKTAGQAAFDLTVNGSSFVNGAQVKYNGSNRTTIFVSDTQLTAQLSAADIATAGSYPVTVVNPGVGASNSVNLVVSNPVPTISSLSPSSKLAGDSSFTLTVTGSSFMTGATIHFGGTDHPANLDDATHVSCTIGASEIATAASISVSVSNAGTSNSGSLTFSVNNPVPSISSLSPSGKIAGNSSFTLTVTGSSFVSGAVIHFGATNHNANLDDATHVSATISAAEIATAGTIPVTVSNQGSSNSSSLDFTVTNPVAVLSGLSPASKLAGEAAFDLTVNGSNFVNGAQIKFNGSNRTTTFGSSTQLTAAISASDIAVAGSFPITVFNPGVGTSNAINLVVSNPVPSISALSPSSKIVGDSSFTLTVTGSSFVTGAVIHFGGTDHPANLDDATHVSATISAAEIASAASIPVTVSNVGSSNSGTLTFSVVNPVAVLSSLTPSSKTAGQSAFGLTVDGSNFIDGAVVKFNGISRTTLFVSSTQLTAQITASDISLAGNFPITVVNPGSSASNGVNLVVVNPVPSISALTPSSKIAGESSFTLSVTGSSFVSGAVIHFGGTDHPANLDDATHVSATISAAEISSPGTIPVTVSNAGTSNSSSLSFTVNNPVAVVSSLSPSSKIAGEAAFDLTVNGSNFVSGAQVKYNGSNRTTVFVSDTQLTAQISAADIATAGTYAITVLNPSASSGSNAVNLVVNNPVPTISSLSPSTKLVGDPSFTLTITGSSFVNGAVIHFGGTDHPANLDDATHVSATISAAEINTVGTIAVTVSNTGSSNSSSLNFTVNNPVPAISSLSPSLKIVGDSAFTLTVTGSSFKTGAVIHFGGTNHPANLDDATHVSATIGAAEIGAAGTIPVTVSNAGTSNSSSLNFTVNNPVASLTSLNPNLVPAGSGALSLTVNGSNFFNGATVKVDGSNRTTSFVNSGQLTASLTASDTASMGTHSITVLNPSSSGDSSGLTLTIANPLPAISALDPDNAVVGEPAFLLNVTGTNFVSGATINFNGTSHTADFVSSSLVRTIIEATEVGTAGVVSVTVTNPAPGGGTSSALSFTVNNPLPVTTSISPSSRTAGTAAFLLTINGTDFVPGSTIQFGGTSHSLTPPITSTQIRAVIEATEITTGGTIPVTVTNPGPGGGTSTALSFTLNNPAPTLTSISPTAKTAGDSGFALTVNGTNFNTSSIVRIDGTDRTTTYVSTTQVTAQITTADLTAAGSRAITVNNPTPGGGTSSSSTLTVNNPAPTITTLSPDNKLIGDAGFSLTVNGTNFNASSVVRIDGTVRTTTFVSATQLTAQILTSDLTTAGTRSITVNNPAPGGGTSSGATFTVNNPAPTLTTIAPTSATVGQPGFTLTVNGTNFNSSSIVQVDGSNRSTTFGSATQLTAQITAADISSAATKAITVFNPAPGGGTSSSVNLDVIVSNPVPAVTTISPDTKTAGDAGFTLTVNGSNFVSASVVRVDGSDRSTSFGSASQLTAQITLADLASPGTRAITVFSPLPGGGLSNSVTLTVNNAVPNITTLSSTTKTAGDAGFTLTVNGSNFVSGSKVRVDGSDRTTSFVNAGQVTAQILASDLVTAGSRAITVFNPAPGGGSSSPATLTVNNPGPSITSLSPNTKNAGDAAFTLSVTGTNFNASSVVRLDGTDHTTAFVDATHITAQITPADVATAGTRAITVFNPAPGGGLSSSSDLTVNNPTPTITSLSSTSKIAGDAAFTLTLTGTNYNSTSVVRVDGSARTTGFNSATELTAQITLADLATAGTRAITVFNPAPGGGASSPSNLTVNNPVPGITGITPNTKTAGDVGFVITVDGSNFNASSVVQIDGSARTTSFVSASQVTAQITTADLAAAATRAITVNNPAPGGGTSSSLTLTINNPLPTVSSISPNAKLMGDLGFTVTVNGTNFNASSVVRMDGSNRTTSFVSNLQLTAQITTADLAAAGTHAITVLNPAPGGGESGSSTLTVSNPVPTLATIAPTSAVLNDPVFPLVVHGTNFNTNSVVQVDGSNRVTTFNSSTQLTAQTIAADLSSLGTRAITVFNPAPGGGTTGAVNLTIIQSNAVPVITSIAPNPKLTGDAAFALSVTGTDFANTAVVRVGGVDHVTSFIDATQLTAQITAADLSTAGTRAITVFNPAPGGGLSNSVDLTINNPVPTITTLSATTKVAGDVGFTMIINGTGFVSGAKVRLDGTDRVTTFVNSGQVTAQILAADLATAGTRAITVFNPLPGGGTSLASTLTVNNPIPTITTLSPATKNAGDLAFVLTVNGTNFNSGSVVRLDGTDRVTTFVSATQVTAQITVADVALSGTRAITVFNPAPGGGLSVASNLTVNNPVPTTTSIAPTLANAGDPAFILSVVGTNFVAGATVTFNGVVYNTPTIVDSSHITVQINATEIATAGVKTVIVTNPIPGGGPSTPALSFTVNNLIPTTTDMLPLTAVAGDPAFTLTVTGTNIVNGTSINFGLNNHPGTFIDSTHVSALIPATDFVSGGTYTVTLTNPVPGGGTSSPALSFTVTNPLPTLTTISTPSKTAGDPAFVLTVTGTNFNASSVVQFNGLARVTTFVSTTSLTAQILATDIAALGAFPITVFNPLPGGGTSNPVNLTVTAVPVPTLTTLSITTVPAGSLATLVTVTGTNFVAGSEVRFNGLIGGLLPGQTGTTTFVSATQLTVSIQAANLTVSGPFPITVVNPAPGGGTSNALTLTVMPNITTLNPVNVRAGTGIGLSLIVNGAGFVTGSVGKFNGVTKSTTFISSTQLSMSISALDIAAVGNYPITVLLPAPTNLTSNAVNLPAIPSLTNLTPMNTVLGSSSFTLTVTGSGFVNGSVIQWNGVTKTTTFVSATSLRCTISSSDVSGSTPYARPVTVLNPAPASLASNPLNFAVTNLPTATECPSGLDVVVTNPGLIDSGPSRSQMWYTTPDNIWWGAFSNNTDGVYFYKRTAANNTWTQGPLIDSNIVAGTFIAGAPDALWDGTNLFLMIQESASLAKLYKYSYTPATTTFTKLAGFPVNIPLVGVGTSGSGKAFGTLAIVKDSTGKLWGAYAGAGLGGDANVRVISSTSADHLTWDTTGTVIGTGVSTLKTEGTAIVSFGGNKVGVAWSNLNTSTNSFRFHNDADPAATWSTVEVVDTGLGPEGTGPVSSKNLTMKAHPDGRLFMVSDDNDGINGHLHLYIRTAAGVWGTKTLVVSNFTLAPGKPTLLLDTDNSEVHVIYKDNAVTTNGLLGQTFITQASMTNPVFNTPCLFLDTSDDIGASSTSNPTTTKQPINATTDLVVAGSTGRRGNRILANAVDVTPNVLSLFSLIPASVTAGESTLTLGVTGKLFTSGSVVKFNNTNRTTTFVNTGKLTASITSSSFSTAGTFPVQVGSSNILNFVVTATNPVPTVGLISPDEAIAGSAQITLNVYGTGFRRTSVVRWKGVNKTTTFVTDTLLTATIPASDLTTAGAFPITVFNGTPGGGTSVANTITTFFVAPSCTPPAGQSFQPGVTFFNTVKSQMWYNDGLWWGAFSDNLAGVYFYKQNGTSYTKGALLDSNYLGRPDMFWNGTNLFALVYEFNTQARLYKFSYNSVAKTYSLISGFPITLPLTGIGSGTTAAQIGSITLAQDSTGKLWASYPGSFIGGDGNYHVIWSTSADHKTWNTTGYTFDIGGASVATQEVAPIVAFGGNKVGIAYSSQPHVQINFMYHVDGDLETTWSAKEIVASGLGHLGIGGVADNHMNMKAAPDGRIFLVAKDSDGSGWLNLYVRTAAGTWNPAVLIDPDPHSMDTRPTLLLDLENSEVYIDFSNATTNYMYLTKANMTNPVFNPVCPYLSVPSVWDSTSTKQNLKSSMGLQVVGSTGGPNSAIHYNAVALTPGSGNVPVLSNISPATGGLNSGPITLTVNGSNFASGAVVYFNGMDRFTTFVSATQLTARLYSTDLETLGTYPITVMNPKGGTSAAVNLTVSVGITALTPASVTAGSPAFTLTVDGSGFQNGAVVRYNGSDRPTSFVSGTQLTAQITAADVATVATVPIVVVNPGGSPSPAMNFIVSNPPPIATSISPNVGTVGGAAFVMTVNGSNFTPTSAVNFNGIAKVTAFVNSTQLTAQIPATDLLTSGTANITVVSPPPGGGTSAPPLGFLINNPVPVVTSLLPATAIVGTTGTLTVNGNSFVSGAVVRFNGVDHVTTFVSSTQLTAPILAADVQATGTIPITVFNPAPGGAVSSPVNLPVNNPVPVVTTISPTSKTAGDAAFTLTVNGTAFVNGAIVRFNGSDRTTAFVSSTQVTAQITAADVLTAGTMPITVFNPLPGGGTSNAVNLTVNNVVPTLTSISPTSKTNGDPAFTITANGTGFVSTSVVRFNGNARTTTFVSATQVTAQITAADVLTAGNFPITVFNPTPGGGPSNAINLVVNANNPVPTIGSIAPNNKMAGDIDFVLTVNGTNFVPTSVVKWGGVAKTTTFVSATQLTALVTAGDIAASGSATVTVENPPPGGGASAPGATFTINPNPRTISVTNMSGGSGTIITVPVKITAQGDENGIGFSLVYNQALLSNPTAVLGADGSGATLNVNTSQVASGRYGIVLSLPAGQTFPAGTRELVKVSFTAATVGVQTDTPINFGDQPVVREVSNTVADTVLTGFAPGTLTITLGYEADVSPRPNGNNNGSVTIADWVQVGRFSSGLDTAADGSEFQRADCAPRQTAGDGRITISDWVQAGRFASGLDTVAAANGPTSLIPLIPNQASAKAQAMTDEMAPVSSVRMTEPTSLNSQQRSFSVEIDTQGTENALGFSLMFDAAKFTFVSAEKSDELSSATLNINTEESQQGRVGIALALPTGQTVGIGKHQVVILTFKSNTATQDDLKVGFTDQPISREVVDINANPIRVTFDSPAGTTNPLEDPQFFVNQQYLDFLNRPADTKGQEFWTNQLRSCGSDVQCLSAKRIEVSAAFFTSPEFQQTGYAIYRLYRAAFGQQPRYQQFMSDRGELVAGPTLAATTSDFANRFVTRPEFLTAYPDSLTADQFVNRLYDTASVDRSLNQRRRAILALTNSTKTRGQVLLDVIENKAFKERESNPAFVLMQYFGYLRRDADKAGFDFWLNILNRQEAGNYHGMVCSFVTSEEYQRRFSQVVPFSNGGCGK